ncbi:uncharacterized protein LOC132614653 isoform X2 [Lycium barbarum]|uniref:uncharacterized protein LOC132614653 isoform X2 n=1 Tax=Lycium barbarum TaxID=112863 RepID=UPI00293EADB1|nr:uncharacterized protein LOC132614653 isoform X2 [Lycium barbarum]
MVHSVVVWADHNKKRCPQLQKGAQTVQDVSLSAPQASQDSEISFMPLRALVDEDDDAEIDDEDEQPILRPKVISEAKTRFQRKKMHQPPTGSRKIGFRGDENGVSRPINLPYSPRKLGWRGEPYVTSKSVGSSKGEENWEVEGKEGQVLRHK